MANDKPVSVEALLAAVLCITSSLIVVGRSPLPPWLFFIGSVVPAAHLLTTSTGSMAADYPMAFGIAWFVLIASDFTLLSHPHRELKWLRQKEVIETAPLFVRVKWVLRLLSSPRGVGWSHEPVGVFRAKPAPGTSRVSFILERVGSVLACVLAVDVSSAYLRYYSTLVNGGASFEERPWYWTMVDLYVWALSVVSNAVLLHTAISIVSVALYLSRPEDWTHLFGYWSDAYTVRRFWGRAWHQCLRRVFSVHGKFIARRVLHAEPGTKTSSYAQLYVAFLISGVMHLIAERKVGMKWTESNCLVFFLLQAVGITAEDAVIAAGRRAGVRSGRVLGYIWTVAWFFKTLPVWWDPKHRAQNMFNRTFLPIELYEGVGERLMVLVDSLWAR